MFEKLIPYDAAFLVLEAYIGYWHQYKRITKRAKIRFENRDWKGIQGDGRARISLYRDTVDRTRTELLDLLGDRAHDPDVWAAMKYYFYKETVNFNTRHIAESFYNSVFRHAHPGLGADEELMFVFGSVTYRESKSALPIFHTFYPFEPIQFTIRQLLGSYLFDAPWEDFERDVDFLHQALEHWMKQHVRPGIPMRIEVLKSAFFRNKSAYIVGRVVMQERITPFIIPLQHEAGGIFADTLLLEPNQISSIFSYNRSYFLADEDFVTEMVEFIHSIIPMKSQGELYNSIGFEKHGKTIIYRELARHMELSIDQFDFAPGIKGMVMAVFALPSYPMVFKVIRDHFVPPKHTTEAEVMSKYELVNKHNRVGRLADTYFFQYLTLDRNRFKPELLEELLQTCGSKVRITGDQVEFDHVYLEKKMAPLNLFLETATPDMARHAIDEYGLAIKQLAAVNIFPGDMLLKNFGVTRLRRVVFYDYDEIGFLTDYNFRRMPQPRDDEEETAGEPWFYVGENDVFPEEFPKFLLGNTQLRTWLYELHGDLFDIAFWQDMQARLHAGELVDVYPYHESLRFQRR